MRFTCHLFRQPRQEGELAGSATEQSTLLVAAEAALPVEDGTPGDAWARDGSNAQASAECERPPESDSAPLEGWLRQVEASGSELGALARYQAALESSFASVGQVIRAYGDGGLGGGEAKFLEDLCVTDSRHQQLFRAWFAGHRSLVRGDADARRQRAPKVVTFRLPPEEEGPATPGPCLPPAASPGRAPPQARCRRLMVGRPDDFPMEPAAAAPIRGPDAPPGLEHCGPGPRGAPRGLSHGGQRDAPFGGESFTVLRRPASAGEGAAGSPKSLGPAGTLPPMASGSRDACSDSARDRSEGSAAGSAAPGSAPEGGVPRAFTGSWSASTGSTGWALSGAAKDQGSGTASAWTDPWSPDSRGQDGVKTGARERSATGDGRGQETVGPAPAHFWAPKCE